MDPVLSHAVVLVIGLAVGGVGGYRWGSKIAADAAAVKAAAQSVSAAIKK